jgi:hypothetical protein
MQVMKKKIANMQRKQLLHLMIIPTSGPQNNTRMFPKNITQAAASAAAAPS